MHVLVVAINILIHTMSMDSSLVCMWTCERVGKMICRGPYTLNSDVMYTARVCIGWPDCSLHGLLERSAANGEIAVAEMC